MPLFADGRIPVTVVASEAEAAEALARRPGAVLAEAPPPALPKGATAMVSFDLYVSPHPTACACCAGRGPVAQALDRLFLARVKGQTPWFDRVVALLPEEAGRAALAEALRDDALAAGRYRMEG